MLSYSTYLQRSIILKWMPHPIPNWHLFCSKSTMETLEQYMKSAQNYKDTRTTSWRRSGVFVVNSEKISHKTLEQCDTVKCRLGCLVLHLSMIVTNRLLNSVMLNYEKIHSIIHHSFHHYLHQYDSKWKVADSCISTKSSFNLHSSILRFFLKTFLSSIFFFNQFIPHTNLSYKCNTSVGGSKSWGFCNIWNETVFLGLV